MAKALARRMDRKIFMVDRSKVKKLKRVLGTSSESEAIRVAVNRALDAEEAIAALERLRRRGTWGKNRLPADVFLITARAGVK